MTGGKRDVEQDIRTGLAESAGEFVVLLRRGSVRTPDGAVRQLVDQSFGSPERLTDAAELLDDASASEARALLVRAARLAADPSPPEAPTVRERPDASRLGASEGAPAPGPAVDEGEGHSGDQSTPPT